MESRRRQSLHFEPRWFLAEIETGCSNISLLLHIFRHSEQNSRRLTFQGAAGDPKSPDMVLVLDTWKSSNKIVILLPLNYTSVRSMTMRYSKNMHQKSLLSSRWNWAWKAGLSGVAKCCLKVAGAEQSHAHQATFGPKSCSFNLNFRHENIDILPMQTFYADFKTLIIYEVVYI
jgi:hypothetical protein